MKHRFESAVQEQEDIKRLQELANMSPDQNQLRPEIKKEIDTLATNIRNLADDLRKRRD